ncbi:hypothetical protein D3C72_887900 [compost metagenome]
MRHFLLLVQVQRLLLGQLGRTLTFERGVVAGVFVDGFLFDMQNFIDDRIQEVAVMRNQHQRARVAFQPALEPDHCVQIQVVGRFVEQQQIRTAHQRLRQVQAHTPAAREGSDWI